MRIVEYRLRNDKIPKKLKIAVISDLHGREISSILSLLVSSAPSLILAPGDILERIDGNNEKIVSMNERGFELLSLASKIAPTFFSLGNHEIGGTGSWTMGFRTRKPDRALWSEENLLRLRESGATLLDDTYVLWEGLAIGGLTSGILNDGGMPKLSFLDDFCSSSCPKILLCHHPEYFSKYLAQRDIDIVVSGHAHGGQWRLFGRGLFAPGQGVFPKYTRGVYHDSLIISAGLKRGGIIPRIFNPPEVVIVNVN